MDLDNQLQDTGFQLCINSHPHFNSLMVMMCIVKTLQKHQHEGQNHNHPPTASFDQLE
jgi:hypothetical protein